MKAGGVSPLCTVDGAIRWPRLWRCTVFFHDLNGNLTLLSKFEVSPTAQPGVYNRTMSRLRRKWVACLSIALLLFAQVAVAGYTCPGTSHGMRMAHGVTSHASKPCHGIDQVSPNLCKQHCEQSAQSIDNRVQAKCDLPVLMNFGWVSSYLVQTPDDLYVPQDKSVRITKPPLYLHHCRFLI